MASISSSEGPEYDEFYDKCSYSDFNSVDSYIIRDIHERRENDQKSGKIKKTKDEESGKFNKRGLVDFFAKLGTCCLPKDKSNHLAENNKGSISKNIFAELHKGSRSILNFHNKRDLISPNRQRSLSSSSSSDVTSSVQNKHKREGTKKTEGNYSNLSNKNSIKWKIVLSNKTDFIIPALSQIQKCLVALNFCLKMENSEKVSQRMIVQLFNAAVLQKDNIDISNIIRNNEEFAILEAVRCIESRILEDSLGDLYGEFAKLPFKGSMYAIISKIRVVAICAQKQGEIVDVCIFDTSAQNNKDWPPAFYGFQDLDSMSAFLLDLFSKDMDVKRATNKTFSTWILRSKLVLSTDSYLLMWFYR